VPVVMGVWCLGMIGLIPGLAISQEVYPSRPFKSLCRFRRGSRRLGGAPSGSESGADFKTAYGRGEQNGGWRRRGNAGRRCQQAGRVHGHGGLSSISVMPEVDKLFGRPQTYKLDDFAPIALLTSDPTILVIKKEAPGKMWPTS